jgi:hypothetical protein
MNHKVGRRYEKGEQQVKHLQKKFSFGQLHIPEFEIVATSRNDRIWI